MITQSGIGNFCNLSLLEVHEYPDVLRHLLLARYHLQSRIKFCMFEISFYVLEFAPPLETVDFPFPFSSGWSGSANTAKRDELLRPRSYL